MCIRTVLTRTSGVVVAGIAVTALLVAPAQAAADSAAP